MQEIGLESSLLDALIEGKKMVEPRLAKGKFTNLNVGDKLAVRRDIWKKGKIIKSIPDAAFIEIIGLLPFGSFEEMINFFGFKRVLPTAKNAKEALKIYRRFYSEKEEKENGILAFEINLLAINKT